MSKTHSMFTAGLLGLALLAPALASGPGAVAAADPPVTTQGTTLSELKQQARKAQKGSPNVQRVGPKPTPPGQAKKDDQDALSLQLPAHGEHGQDHATMHAHEGGDDTEIRLAAAAPIQGPTDLAPAVGGQWNDVAATLPTANIHTALLNSGKVLIIAGSSNQWENFPAGNFTSVLWNPTDNSMKRIATPHDMFCAGHVVLRDGRLLVLGGTTAYPQYTNGQLTQDWKGSKKSYIFDPISETYQATDDMAVGRWYPGVLRMGDDSVIAVGGLDETGFDTEVNERFIPTPGSTWDSFKGGSWVRLANRPWPQYAHMILAADGRAFYTGQSTANRGEAPGLWNPTTNAFQRVDGLPNMWQRNSGASVLLPPAQAQRVMVMGGGDWELPSLKDAHIVDLKASMPRYTPAPDMANPKMYVGAITLPDSTVLQTNGAQRFREDAVRDAQVYNPVTNSWTTMNSPTIDRLYHSTALLLPDGRVATLGSQVVSGENELRVSIFSPPYLFKGKRPAITGGPTWIDYDEASRHNYNVTMEAGSTISKVSLVRPSATTHSTDTEQRLVDIPFTRPTAGTVSIQLPTNRNILPPGWYMLNIVDDKGRPSVSRWVSVN